MDYKPDEQVLSTTFSGAKKLIFSIKFVTPFPEHAGAKAMQV
jgi:hypothetical protein